ncbi:hypothetical protein [uncultured Actinomyces sp.]|nr:hypothetical protein [uncultured Actinomyces sp.]
MGDASDEAADDASDNNAVVSFLRVDPGSHLRAGARLPRWVARLFHVS